MTIILKGEPIGKPRMTQQDKWKQRPCVVRYRAWADALRLSAGISEKITLVYPVVLTVKAFIGMPRSWSHGMKSARAGTPHTSKPDGDNILKGVGDALFINDQYIFDSRIEKRWDDGDGPRVEIRIS